MKYKFFEHTADLGIEGHGKNLNELFKNCALAIFECTANIKKIDSKEERKIKLKNKKIDDLLYDFLSEIIYLRDADSIIFKDCDIKIGEGKEYVLNANLVGEHINHDKHELFKDIKAITLHMFEVKKVKNEWTAKMIVDI